jgi:prepilin-type N-terminal cleavage/methylation domain-containing protein
MLVRTREIKNARLLRGGYTLMEMLVVVAIIVILASIGGYYLLPQVDVAKHNADLAQLKTITQACETFHLQNDRWPQNLDELTGPSPQGGPALMERTNLISKTTGEQFKYDASGPNHQGLKPDIWADGPGVKIGNWMQKPQAN